MNQGDLKKAFAVQTFHHPDLILIGARSSAILVGDSIQVIANVHINHLEPLALAS